MSDTDKRSTHTDALATLGTIITENEKRDAIHLAVENVVAGESLAPGDHVGWLSDGRVGIMTNKKLGIVDPFLTEIIKENERFWLILYPRQITSLRHVWSHPDFSADTIIKKSKKDAELWLRKYINNGVNINFSTVINCITYDLAHSQNIEVICLPEDIDGDRTITPEFWENFEIYTSRKVPQKQRANYFRCAC